MKKFKWELVLSVIIMVMLSITIFVSNGISETTHWTWGTDQEWDIFTLVYVIEGESEQKQLVITKDTVITEADEMKFPGPKDMIPGVTYSAFMFATLNGQEGDPSVPFLYTKKLDTPLGLVFVNGTLNWLPAIGEYDGYLITYTIAGETKEIVVDKEDISAEIEMACGGSFIISIVSTLGDLKSDSSAEISGDVPPCAPTNLTITFN